MKKSAILSLLVLLGIIFGVSPVNAASWPGSDGYGYNGSSATYSWIEISGTGTLIPGLTDDSYAGPYNIGFTFNFYGTDYTQFYVGSNGFISFGAGNSTLTNQCPLPDGNSPNDIIAILWDDLNSNYTTGGVYYQTFANCPVGTGQCLVVEYRNWNHFGGAAESAGTWEAVLYDNGNVLLQFQDSGTELGSGSTTGIENNNAGSDYGLTYACNAGSSVSDNSAILFSNATGGTLQGTVVDSVSSNPVVGATVSVDNGSGYQQSTTTNGSGYYVFSNLPADTYAVTVSATCYTSATVNGVVVVASTTTTQDFSLIPSCNPTISGLVTYAGSKAGLVYVAALTEPCNSGASPIAQDGPLGGPYPIAYSLTVPPGTYYICAFLDASGDGPPPGPSDPTGELTNNPITMSAGISYIEADIQLQEQAVAVPTMTEWGMIIFVALIGLAAAYYRRRQKRANN